MNWWKSFFRKDAYDAQLDSEIRFHIERLTEEKIAAGWEPGMPAAEGLLGGCIELGTANSEPAPQ